MQGRKKLQKRSGSPVQGRGVAAHTGCSYKQCGSTAWGQRENRAGFGLIHLEIGAVLGRAVARGNFGDQLVDAGAGRWPAR